MSAGPILLGRARSSVPVEWQSLTKVSERDLVRKKLESAYRENCGSFEELLETVCSIHEELLLATAPSRLDYFKAACDFPAKVSMKRRQLGAGGAPGSGAV